MTKEVIIKNKKRIKPKNKNQKAIKNLEIKKITKETKISKINKTKKQTNRNQVINKQKITLIIKMKKEQLMNVRMKIKEQNIKEQKK